MAESTHRQLFRWARPDQVIEALDAAQKQVGAHRGALRGIGSGFEGEPGASTRAYSKDRGTQLCCSSSRAGPDCRAKDLEGCTAVVQAACGPWGVCLQPQSVTDGTQAASIQPLLKATRLLLLTRLIAGAGCSGGEGGGSCVAAAGGARSAAGGADGHRVQRGLCARWVRKAWVGNTG